jgi:hypothetical protein
MVEKLCTTDQENASGRENVVDYDAGMSVELTEFLPARTHQQLSHFSLRGELLHVYLCYRYLV